MVCFRECYTCKAAVPPGCRTWNVAEAEAQGVAYSLFYGTLSGPGAQHLTDDSALALLNNIIQEEVLPPEAHATAEISLGGQQVALADQGTGVVESRWWVEWCFLVRTTVERRNMGRMEAEGKRRGYHIQCNALTQEDTPSQEDTLEP
eukprot:g20922.t1